MTPFSSPSMPMPADSIDDPTRAPSLRLLLAESRVAWEAVRFLRVWITCRAGMAIPFCSSPASVRMSD